MKKFKKPLAINVPQDEGPEAKSPNHIVYKESKQRPLLMYNEHTIASSANNQDQPIEQEDRQQATCQEFPQYHGKGPFQTKNSQTNQNHQPGNKTQKYKKFNVIQFEQFSIQGDKSESHNQNTIHSYNFAPQGLQKKDLKNNKRQFSIQIPQNEDREDKQEISVKFAFDIKNEGSTKPIKETLMKEPPAPSNKSKLNKTLNRHFVFPTNDEENYIQTTGGKKEKQGQKVIAKNFSEEEHEKKIKELNLQWSQKLQAATKSFQKQRQQFYKEKSSLQKDLMIKDGQIEMLQKLITNRYSPKQSATNKTYNYSNNQFAPNEKQQPYKSSSFNTDKPKTHLYISDEKVSNMETTLLEKDLQINSLLQKINQLNSLIDKKNNELEDVKINLMKSQKMNESLRNEVYIYEKKEESQKVTKQFYKMKQGLIQVQQQSSKTPKGYSRSKWQQDLDMIDKEKPKSPEKNEYPLRGIDDLHKRLQSLKMNRIELQNRGRIKSELAYPQTSKNKTKGTFDFKGKFYDRDRDYINQSRMY